MIDNTIFIENHWDVGTVAYTDPEGVGVRIPSLLKNHNATGFLSNTGPEPLKNHKANKPTFNVGQTSAASERPFKWRSAGGPMMARF